MIIGKDTNFQANRNTFLKENNNQSNNPINPLVEANRVMQHTDVMSKSEMNHKAYSMLEDRLQKGLITMDEFNKKCRELGRK